jgi:phosphoglycerol transferase MdoB-like AlkP superfamily enzyme
MSYTFLPLIKKYRPVLVLAVISIFISFITRLVLMIYTAPTFDLSFVNIAGIFGIGLFYDLCAFSFISIPFVLHIWFTNEKTYQSGWKWVAIGIYLVLIAWIAFFNLIPKEYNKDLPKAILALISLRFLIFLLLLWRGKEFRVKWRTAALYIDFFIIIFLLLFNAVSEFFFWQEFGSRYNFIAVDYLVYTNEVVGNINESYPVAWIFLVIFIITIPVFFFTRKYLKRSVRGNVSFVKRTAGALVLLAVTASVYLFVTGKFKTFSADSYANELAGNGLYEFGAAFLNNELDYYTFYQTIPDDEAFRIVRKQLAAPYATFTGNDPFSLERDIHYNEPERHLNVVMISVESFSASFMKAFGNKQNITPYLDSLSNKSIFFTNLYATGTRTVRGLEALSLSIPPLPGQSIVRRPGNENLFSLGAVLKSKGYSTQFFYGGYSSFDNMGYYFSHNNYDVIDRTALKENEIHYANIWGVADEDMFSLALKKLDEDYNNKRPFFAQVMTVSNHRPFTYPAGRIDIAPETQTREGAVKYTDYAIGKFIEDASQKPWFNNTVFVIIADHCAYAAGKVALPVTGYHIPMLIYSPANLPAQNFGRMVSQIDVVPTILGLLNMNYRSKFFGQDVLHLSAGNERAFISTYQGLGYLKEDKLIIQMPPKKVEAFVPDFTTGKADNTTVSDSLRREAIAYYQTAAWLLKHRRYDEIPWKN